MKSATRKRPAEEFCSQDMRRQNTQKEENGHSLGHVLESRVSQLKFNTNADLIYTSTNIVMLDTLSTDNIFCANCKVIHTDTHISLAYLGRRQGITLIVTVNSDYKATFIFYVKKTKQKSTSQTDFQELSQEPSRVGHTVPPHYNTSRSVS